MARFGPKQGKDSENLVVHFKQEFLGMPSPPPPNPFPPESYGAFSLYQQFWKRQWKQQQRQQCIHLHNYNVFNTLCPANSFYANLGRTIKILNKDDIKLHEQREKEKNRNTITYRKKHLTYQFKYRDNPICLKVDIDCKTVRIFACSSTREKSNKRSGTRLKTESETWAETLKIRSFSLASHALRAYGTLYRFLH